MVVNTPFKTLSQLQKKDSRYITSHQFPLVGEKSSIFLRFFGTKKVHFHFDMFFFSPLKNGCPPVFFLHKKPSDTASIWTPRMRRRSLSWTRPRRSPDPGWYLALFFRPQPWRLRRWMRNAVGKFPNTPKKKRGLVKSWNFWGMSKKQLLATLREGHGFYGIVQNTCISVCNILDI